MIFVFFFFTVSFPVFLLIVFTIFSCNRDSSIFGFVVEVLLVVRGKVVCVFVMVIVFLFFLIVLSTSYI